MTYIRPFLRLVVGGQLHTLEQFAFGVNLVADDVPAGGAPSTVPQAVIDAVQSYVTSPQVMCSSATVRYIKLNLIGTNGRYVSDSDTVVVDGLSFTGTVQNTFPPQIALAISLRTDKQRGRAHAGRYYLPAPAGNIQADGGMSTSAQSTHLIAAHAFLVGLNAALSPGSAPAGGWSVGVVSNVGTGAEEVVRKVRVGHLYDTMRSRRESLAERYEEMSL